MYNKELFKKICDVECGQKELEDFCSKIDKQEFDLEDSFNKYYNVETIVKAIELCGNGMIDDRYLACWTNAYNWIIMASVWEERDNKGIKGFEDFIVWEISDSLDSLSFYNEESKDYYNLKSYKKHFMVLDMILKAPDKWRACIATDCDPEEENYEAYFLAVNENEKSYTRLYFYFDELNEKETKEQRISLADMRKRVVEMKKNGYKDLSFLNGVEDFIYIDLGADDFKKGKNWSGFEVYEPVYEEKQTIGMPLIVLVKDDEIRLSTPEESLEYLEFSSKKGKKKKCK